MKPFSLFLVSATVASLAVAASSASANYRRYSPLDCLETSSLGSATSLVPSEGAIITNSSYPEVWCPFDYDTSIPIGCTTSGCASGAYVDLYNESGATAQACVTYFDDRGTGGLCDTASSSAGTGHASLLASGVSAWTMDSGPYDYAYVFVDGLGSGTVRGYVVVTY